VITLGPSAQVTLVLYLWSNLICFVCHVEISRTTTLHVALLVSSKSSQCSGVHWLGLRLFGATMWKLLVIEPFSQWKLNKIENLALGKSHLIEFISQFSELRCERYWFWVYFVAGNSNKLQYLGLKDKISWAV
jgi:hypothetical protein